MTTTAPTYTTQLPTLVAFVVGDAIEFVPRPWPRAKFREALVDTLEDFGDPWVICECLNPSQDRGNKDNHNWLNVTKTILDARDEYSKIQTSKQRLQISHSRKKNESKQKLEMAKTGDTQNSFCLIGFEGSSPEILSNERTWPDLLKTILEEVQKKNCETVHNAMLILEEKLSKTSYTPVKLEGIEDIEFKMKIPTIVIVVEGDLRTIKHVAEAVEENIPVLLVRGSGMAADLIGYCLNEEDVLKTRAPLLFGICFTEEDFIAMEIDIYIIKKYKSNITEFDIDAESVTSLKDRVTDSIIRDWAMVHASGGKRAATIDEYNPPPKLVVVSNDGKSITSEDVLPNAIYDHQLSPCSRPNKIQPISEEAVRPKTGKRSTSNSEVTNEISSNPTGEPKTTNGTKASKPSPLALYMLYQIFQTGQDTVSNKENIGKSLLLYALRENLYDLTERLVDMGVQLPWTVKKGDEKTGKGSDIRSLYKELHDERTKSEKDTTRTCIAEIIKLPNEEEPLERLKIWKVGHKIINFSNKHLEPKEENDPELMSSDLLLWAVLTNRMEMAEIFWKRSPEPILTALISCAILRKMSRRAHKKKEHDMENKMLQHSRVFLQRAIDVTERLFEINEQETLFLLEQENKTSVWGIQESALVFSQAHNIFKFVANHVPQRSFARIWKGGNKLQLKDLYETTIKESCKDYCKESCIAVWPISPRGNFYIHYVFFCLFLVCLSAFVMTNITPEKWPIDVKSVYEYCAYLWLFGDIFEEYVPSLIYTFKQLLHPLKWKRRAFNHMNNFWNAMDALFYAVLILGIIIRFTYETTDFGISRRFYTIGLFLMYMRFLHVLLITRKIGPTVIMLKEGLKELMRFVIIMIILILSVGVFYHANIYPNHYDMFSTFGMQYWSVWKIIYYPYWSIYGEFKDEIGGEDSTGNCSFNQTVYMNNRDIVRCPEQDWMVSLMSGFFVLILNLLLVNLIIAMFSYRFEEIKNNSDQFFKFHRSQVIMEFQERIPVPFNLLVRCIFFVIWICKWIFKKCKEEAKEDEDPDYRTKLDEVLAQRWMLSGSDAQRLFDN